MNAAELGHQMGLMIPLAVTQNILMNLGFSTSPLPPPSRLHRARAIDIHDGVVAGGESVPRMVAVGTEDMGRDAHPLLRSLARSTKTQPGSGCQVQMGR
jgi:hypothetical protein